MSGWVDHRAGRNSVERIQYLAAVGKRNTIPRTSGHYNDNVVTAPSNDTYQFESNSSDNDYYFGDYDSYFSNDNYIDNDNSLTETKNLIYAT
jgi:hypothetical protein